MVTKLDKFPLLELVNDDNNYSIRNKQSGRILSSAKTLKEIEEQINYLILIEGVIKDENSN